MTKIEQVARHLGQLLDGEEFVFHESSFVLQKRGASFPAIDLRMLARSAIEAMREPTDGMYDAYRCDEMWRELNSREVWDIWIDAALNEKGD